MAEEKRSRLQEMMQADEENVANCRKTFRGFHENLEFLLDEIADHYTVLADAIGKIVHGEELTLIAKLAEEAGVPIEEFAKLIDSGDSRPLVAQARTAKQIYLAREIRILMFLACKRQYLWGAADLLKFKVTPAMGYLRQQCESVGFLHLFLQDPSLAVKWSDIRTPEDGVAFYRSTQGDLKKVMSSFELVKAYEFGSATALHVRLASLVRGAPVVVKTAPTGPRFSVPYQEIDKENPFRFFLSVLNYIRNQERILIALGKAFPEVNTEAFLRDVGHLQRIEAELWKRLEETFPADVDKTKVDAKTLGE
jgi:hypothetical protein